MNKILVIDDQKIYLLKIKDILENSIPDCIVLTSQSGNEGIRIAKKEQPDTILLDVMMPEIDGYEVCENLRIIEQTKSIPVIMISGFQNDTESRIKGLESGADVFLSKPINPAELSAQVSSMLRIRRAEKAIIEKQQMLKDSNQQLKESERKINTWIQNSPVCTKILDLDFNLKFMSSSGVRDLKIDDITEFYGKPYPLYFYPDSFKISMVANLKKAKETGEIITQEASVIDIDGNKIWYLSTIVPVNDEVGKLDYIMIVSLDTSKRMQTEEALKLSEEKFKAISASAQDAIIMIDNNENVSYWNKMAEKMFDYTAEETLNKNLHKIILPSKYYQSQKIGFGKFKNTGEGAAIGRTTELAGLKKDGTEFPVELSLSSVKIKNKWNAIGIVRDITERKKAEVEIKKLSVAVEQSANTIVITDIEGNIEYANPKFEDLTGYTLDEALGQNPRILNAGTQPKEYYADMWKTISSGEIWKGEFHNKKKNGELFWENVTITPLKNDDGIITNYLAIKENITTEKLASEALKQHARQLQERNEDLDAFSHTVAHDLKNPIGTIMGFSEILLEDYNEFTNDEIIEYLGLINNDSKKTNQIIDSLLLFANIRKEDIIKVELNMPEIIDYAIKRLLPLIKESNAKISIADVWPVSLGYAPWIEEVLINFLSNAIKYGGTPPRIEIGADTDSSENIPKGMIRFWVRDNGPGISAANKKLLFKKFERLDQVKIEGHGLGLSIVRRIIEKLNGQVGVESELGEGSLFILPYRFSLTQQFPKL